MARNDHFCGRTRRQFIWQAGAGFTGVALASLLDRDGFLFRQANAVQTSDNGDAANPFLIRDPQFAPKAKQCIFLFMTGGPSQMDLFDYKPELNRRDGQTISIEFRNGHVGDLTLLGSRRRFAQYGESGQWCSDALPHISQHMDKLAVIKSLYCDSFAHGSALLQVNTGRTLQGHPSLGAWLGYGLGSFNSNLPGFVVLLDPRSGPIAGTANWSSGYMPAAYQGTVFRSTGQPILNLQSSSGRGREVQRSEIDAINALNAEHMASRPGVSELQARIASYELAYKLQMTAPEALDLSQETKATLDMYGLDDPKPDIPDSEGPAPFGRQCLIARRLVERGVRFVQLYNGGNGGTWDAHGEVELGIRQRCAEVDKPIAALLTDLDQRGLLDETLVVWGGEFGRQATCQTGEKMPGRDHNPRGFTYWLAGGGTKAGVSYGETNDIGQEAVVDAHHIRDLHATILHQMGIDHEKLTYFFGGFEQKLTGVEYAAPIDGIMA